MTIQGEKKGREKLKKKHKLCDTDDYRRELPVGTNKAEDLCEKCVSQPAGKFELSATFEKDLYWMIHLAGYLLNVVVTNLKSSVSKYFEHSTDLSFWIIS